MERTASEQREPRWMQAFGGLRDLHKETKDIERAIEEEFEQIEEEDWLLMRESDARLFPDSRSFA